MPISFSKNMTKSSFSCLVKSSNEALDDKFITKTVKYRGGSIMEWGYFS